MNHYAYAFRCEQRDNETFFKFLKFPEIISSLSTTKFRSFAPEERIGYATDAVLTALQLNIASKADIPGGDRLSFLKAGQYVALSVTQAMKLELYRVYLGSGCRSVSEFARSNIGKSETLVRRLLDLRHSSQPKEIEEVLCVVGKRLVHNWDLEDLPIQSVPKRNIRSRPNKGLARQISL